MFAIITFFYKVHVCCDTRYSLQNNGYFMVAFNKPYISPERQEKAEVGKALKVFPRSVQIYFRTLPAIVFARSMKFPFPA